MTPAPEVDSDRIALIKAAIQLAEGAHTRFNQRREIEWKVTIGAWTLLAAAAVFVTSDRVSNYGSILGATVAFFAYVRWMFAIWVANGKDKTERDYFLKQAKKGFGETASKEEDDDSRERQTIWGFLKDGSMMGQLLTTFGLLVCVGSIVYSSPSRSAVTDRTLQSFAESATKIANSAEGISTAAKTVAEQNGKDAVTEPRKSGKKRNQPR